MDRHAFIIYTRLQVLNFLTEESEDAVEIKFVLVLFYNLESIKQEACLIDLMQDGVLVPIHLMLLQLDLLLVVLSPVILAQLDEHRPIVVLPIVIVLIEPTHFFWRDIGHFILIDIL